MGLRGKGLWGIAVCVWLLLRASTIAGVIQVGGIISTNTTWLGTDTIIVTSTVTVNSPATLTIQPGARVMLATGTQIVVNYGLVAVGTAANHITFTSRADTTGGIPAPGNWACIAFNDASDAVQCRLEYCDIRYMQNGVLVSSNTGANRLRIRHCDIRRASSYCAQIYYSQTDIDSCTLKDFGSMGIYIYGAGAALQVLGCVIDQDSLFYRAGTGIGMNFRASVTVIGSSITDCYNGIDTYNTDFSVRTSLSLSTSTIANNANYGVWYNAAYYGNGTYFYTTTSTIANCNFFNNGAYNVYCIANNDNTLIIDARGNWWGSANGYQVAAAIYDNTDNNSCSQVNFSGFLNGSYPGGIAVQNFLTCQPTQDSSLTAGAPIHIVGNYLVPRGRRLNIAAGAQIFLGPNVNLSIDGQIRAEGTSANHILFTSSADTSAGAPVIGAWRGIHLGATSDSAECLINYCDIRYPDQGIDVYQNSFPYPAVIKNCEIRKLSNRGMYINDATITVDSCRIIDFASYGIHVYGTISPLIMPRITNCSIYQDTIVRVGTGSGLFLYNLQAAQISNCTISNCNNSVNCNSYTASNSMLDIDSCDFVNSSSHAVYISSNPSYPSATGHISYCNFNGFGGNAIRGDQGASPQTTTGIDARFNWWGTADPFSVESRIYDYADNNLCPSVDYSAPLSAPFPGGSAIPGCLSGKLQGDLILPSGGGPYKLLGAYYVRRGSRLTIQPGTKILYGSTGQLYVDGQIIAEGTQLNPITFTSRRDTTGGQPTAGDWSGISLLSYSDSATCSFRYCNIRYAVTALSLDENRTPYPATIRNCVIEDVNNRGVSVINASPVIDSCTIRGFLNYGVFIQGGVSPAITPTLSDCRIYQDTVTLIGSATCVYQSRNTAAIIRGCDLYNSWIGVSAFTENGYPAPPVLNISACNIYSNSHSGLYLIPSGYNAPYGVVRNCNITDNAQYAVYESSGNDSLTTAGIDARYNWWGTIDPFVIGQKVYEYTDNAAFAPVKFNGFLNAAYPAGIPVETGLLSGRISHDTALTISQSPYRMISSVFVPAGVRMNIEPGVKIYCDPTTDINIAGLLTAVGTPSAHIVFTASADTIGGMPALASWYGVDFKDQSDAAQCLLDYCDIRFANGGIDVYSSASPFPLKVKHCDIRQAYTGIYIKNSTVTVDSCLIEDFRDYGVYVEGMVSYPHITNTTIDQDTATFVRLNGSGLHATDGAVVYMSGCVLTDCVYGVYAYTSVSYNVAPTLHVVNSRISNNGSYGILISTPNIGYYTPRGEIRYCNITGNNSGGRAFQTNACYDANTIIDARYNYWGTSDSAVIANNYIYDHYDYSYHPFVTFMPVATSENKKPCPSDFNMTGRTDYDDLAMLGYSFGSSPGGDNWREVCNIVKTGISNSRVDGFDLALFGSQYGVAGGCYPFAKPSFVQFPKDSFVLVAEQARDAEAVSYRFTVDKPSQFRLLGVMFDIVLDTATVDLAQFRKNLQPIRSDNMVCFTSLVGNRFVYSVMSLDGNTSVEQLFEQPLVCPLRDGAEDFATPVADIDNVALVLDGYELLTDPQLRLGGVPEALPNSFSLSQNYPNPFNPVTTIEYAVPRKSDIRLEIFNVLGQRVRLFTQISVVAGTHRVVWDGTDQRGTPVSSGVYLYRLEAGDFNQTRKMILVK